MNETVGPTFDARRATSTVEHELRLVEEAIAAVASGRFPRVTVAGLRFGDEVLPAARSLAEGRAVRISPLTSNDEHGTALVVEAATEASST